MRQSDEHTQHLDEGTIHAWLDGALAPDESATIEAHVASCERCAAGVAEARGLMAAASRVLSALDDIPAGVIPGSRDEGGAPRDQLARLRARHASEKAASRRRWWRNGQMVAAASVVFVALGTATVFWRGSFRADALPGAAAVEMDSGPRIASDAVAPSPPPSASVSAPMPIAEATGAGASAEKKAVPTPEVSVTSRAPAVPESSAREAPQRLAEQLRDEARERQAEALSPTQRAQAPQLQGLQRQGGTEQQQMNFGIRQETQRQTQDAAKTSQAAGDAARPAAPPTPRADSIATAYRSRAAESVVTSLAVVGCYTLSTVPGDASDRGLPARLRLDSARVRSAGDTTWYRAVSLGADSASGFEWRRVDATTIELAALDAGVGAASGDRRVTRIALMSGVEQLLTLRNAAPTTVASGAPARLPRVASRVVGAVRMVCPR